MSTLVIHDRQRLAARLAVFDKQSQSISEMEMKVARHGRQAAAAAAAANAFIKLTVQNITVVNHRRSTDRYVSQSAVTLAYVTDGCASEPLHHVVEKLIRLNTMMILCATNYTLFSRLNSNINE